MKVWTLWDLLISTGSLFQSLGAAVHPIGPSPSRWKFASPLAHFCSHFVLLQIAYICIIFVNICLPPCPFSFPFCSITSHIYPYYFCHLICICLSSLQFIKFANIEEDTPSYHRRYDFFVSKFSEMCWSSHTNEETREKWVNLKWTTLSHSVMLSKVFFR